MDRLKSQIQNYTPFNEREADDKVVILQCMDDFDNLLSRENRICHFTASCWIVNRERTKALILHHNLENAWRWPGGHNDGESDMLKVALQEAREETSLGSIRPLSEDIFSLEILSVSSHVRKGKLVNSHLHLNCGLLFEADETEAFQIKPDENSAICWMTFAEIEQAINDGDKKMDPLFLKLIEKTKTLA